MLFARIVLVVTGLAFAIYGFFCLVSPSLVAEYSGIELPTVSAITEVVAMYGGLQLGVGLLFIVCAAHPTRLTIGLVVMVAVVGSLAMGRSIGLLVHGSSSYNLGALAYEGTTTLLGLLALKLHRAAQASA